MNIIIIERDDTLADRVRGFLKDEGYGIRVLPFVELQELTGNLLHQHLEAAFADRELLVISRAAFEWLAQRFQLEGLPLVDIPATFRYDGEPKDFHADNFRSNIAIMKKELEVQRRH